MIQLWNLDDRSNRVLMAATEELCLSHSHRTIRCLPLDALMERFVSGLSVMTHALEVSLLHKFEA
jgi:hypothetical protein